MAQSLIEQYVTKTVRIILLVVKGLAYALPAVTSLVQNGNLWIDFQDFVAAEQILVVIASLAITLAMALLMLVTKPQLKPIDTFIPSYTG